MDIKQIGVLGFGGLGFRGLGGCSECYETWDVKTAYLPVSEIRNFDRSFFERQAFRASTPQLSAWVGSVRALMPGLQQVSEDTR